MTSHISRQVFALERNQGTETTQQQTGTQQSGEHNESVVIQLNPLSASRPEKAFKLREVRGLQRLR